MIKPAELQSSNGDDIWSAIVAASAGDVATLQRLLEQDPHLARAEYWYAPVVHFAVREGHLEAVRMLLDAGADPESNGLNDRNLIEMARERGYEHIAEMLEQQRERRGRVVAQSTDHPIHPAAARGETDVVRAILDADLLSKNADDICAREDQHWMSVLDDLLVCLVVNRRRRDEDTELLEALTSLDGVSVPMASAILTLTNSGTVSSTYEFGDCFSI
jgi:hypothetical protein